jgi:phage terminase large subunit-like protein
MTTKAPTSTGSTARTSRRSAGTAHRPLEPFSVDHYRAYARLSVLDSGDFFDPEDWELELVGDLFAGAQENWWVLPEGSGKTTFVGHIALYFGDFTPMANIPVAASSREQAEIMYRQSEGFVIRTASLRKRFRCYSGYRRIKCLRTEGRIQVYAADDRTADGVIPGGLALVDELHRHRDLKLYRTWRGKLEKRGAQLVTISTAGEPGGEFEETRSRIKRDAGTVEARRGGCHVRAAGDNIVLHDFAVPEARLADDMDVVARANPRAEITATVLRRKRDSPTMTREHWLRFVCNIATLTGGSAILPEDWDAWEQRDPTWQDDAWRTQFLDLGWKIDTTSGGVLVWDTDERRIVTGIQVIAPPVDESDVVAGILHRQIDYDADRVVLDPSAGAEQMVQLLEKGTHPLQTDDELRIGYGLPALEDTRVGELEFVAHSQDNAPMSQAAARLDEAMRNGWLIHDGDRELRKHALNAVAKPLGDAKWKFDRPADAKGDNRRNYPIDALTGVLMGHNVAVDEASEGAGFVFEVMG